MTKWGHFKAINYIVNEIIVILNYYIYFLMLILIMKLISGIGWCLCYVRRGYEKHPYGNQNFKLFWSKFIIHYTYTNYNGLIMAIYWWCRWDCFGYYLMRMH